MLKTREVPSFEQLHRLVAEGPRMRTIFRGVHSAEYQLLPLLGRVEPLKRQSLAAVERRMMRLFKEGARPYLDRVPLNEWEWLALAQHHGLPTRLMDWTTNPLVAAFFAVERPGNEPSAIWVYSGPDTVDLESESDPYRVGAVKRFRPPVISLRIQAQAALHTIHPNPRTPFRSSALEKWLIPVSYREQLKNLLYKYGVSRRSLFPGIESVAEDAAWLHLKRH